VALIDSREVRCEEAILSAIIDVSKTLRQHDIGFIPKDSDGNPTESSDLPEPNRFVESPHLHVFPNLIRI
jgi:hypothetical protein